MKRISFFPLIVNKCLSHFYYSSLATNAQPIQGKIHLRHVELIHSFIGGGTERIKSALSRNSNIRLQLEDEKIILQKLKIIQDMILDDQNSVKIIQLLSFHSIVLKERYKLLREYGVLAHKISSTTIKRCFSIFKSSVSKLKNKKLIKTEYDVMKNLWETAGLDPDTCPIVPESFTLHEMKIITCKAFMKQRLDCSIEDLTSPEEEIIYRMKNKSFDTMNKNLDIFQNIIGLSNRRMANNWFILVMEPEKTLDLLYRVKEVAKIDMKTALFLYPNIATRGVENLEKIVQYIEAENIPIEYGQRRLELFTLNAETIRARLTEIKEEEFFRLNIKNPRILEIVYFLVKAKKRLAVLEELRVNPTLASLSGTHNFFERFCENGLMKPFNADIVHYVCTELNLERRQLVNAVRRHRRWCYVPLVHVGKNLQSLREHFSDEEILKYVYILFYYSGKLKREMEELNNREGIDDFKEDGSVKKEYVLPLLLYYLEKESNFTGESIWDSDDQNPYQDLPDLPVDLHKC